MLPSAAAAVRSTGVVIKKTGALEGCKEVSSLTVALDCSTLVAWATDKAEVSDAMKGKDRD